MSTRTALGGHSGAWAVRGYLSTQSIGEYCKEVEKKYKVNLKEMTKQGQNSNFTPTIGNTRGRPLLLDEELDLKLSTMIITLQTAGAGISAHIVRGVFERPSSYQSRKIWQVYSFPSKLTLGWIIISHN